jgi:hypothetical protein
MADSRVAPLVPAEVDLTDFQYMELDVRLLRDSKFAAEVEPEAFRAGVLLWCASWHQIPAGSLPDNDVELSNLAGFGRVVKEWKKVRAQALSLFVACSDGRLYHPVIAAKAVAAWESKLRHQHSRLLERMRKENKNRADKKLDPLPLPTFDQWNSERLAAGIPAETPPPSAGIPPENALRGNGEGTEQNGTSLLSEANASGGQAAEVPPKPAMDPAEIIFGYGVPLLVSGGSTDKAARSFLGALRKVYGDPKVVDALRDCIRAKPLEPTEWLAKALPPKPAKTSPDDELARRAASNAEAARLLGFNGQETIDA